MADQSITPWLIHFPIVVLVIGVALDLYGLARRHDGTRHVALYLLVAGFVGSLLSAFLGFRSAHPADGAASSSAALHQILSIMSLAIFGGLLLLRAALRRQKEPRIMGMYLVLAIAGIIALIVAGLFGTELLAGFSR